MLFFLIFLDIEDRLFEERFLDEFELGSFNEGVLDGRSEVIKVFVKARCFRVPVSDGEVGKRFEGGVRGAVVDGESVADEVEDSF
jgi:hypothetical protein